MGLSRHLWLSMSLVAALVGCQGKSGGHGDDGDAAKAAVGAAAPRYTGKTIDGEYIQLEDFRGKVVLLNMWATWCEPCKKELPELASLHRRHASRGFSVVGVSVDKPQALGKVRQLVGQFGIDYPIVFDPSGEAVATFELTGYPTSFLLGRDGKIRWRRNGIIKPQDQELGAEIEAALAVPP